MQSLEPACEEEERSIKKIKLTRSSHPSSRPQESSSDIAGTSRKPKICIFTKLLELHEELAGNDDAQVHGLNLNSFLLDKLVARERLNTLILNLYPENKGYSFAVRRLPRTDTNSEHTANMRETVQWPYEKDELLRYIDNEELPPFITKTFERQCDVLFYSGCIIAEVRDYRHSFPHIRNVHHVLLRPILKNLLADINNMTTSEERLSHDERLQLESHLLMANQPGLCLDPDNAVSNRIAQLHNTRQSLNSEKFRRSAYKGTKPALSRKRQLDALTHRHGLDLYEFTMRAKTKPKTGQSLSSVASNMPKKLQDVIKPIPVQNLDSPLLSPPSQGAVINKFKMYQRPEETDEAESSLPQLTEEYVLETDMPSKEKGKPSVYHIKLSILQRPSTFEYLGELYLDRDHKKNERNGVACRFSLGSRANANRYIHQFMEIFTESGRKSVRYDMSIKDRVTMVQAQAMEAQNSSQPNLVQQHLNQLRQQSQTQMYGVTSGMGLIHPNQSQNTSAVPILQSHLQGTNHILASKLIEQSETTEKNKQLQQQQIVSTSNNSALLKNILNGAPVNAMNNDASATIVKALNSATTTLQQGPNVNPKLLARSVANARVLNHSDLIALNNNRLSVQEIGQHPQTITFASVNSGNSFTSFPIKSQVNQRIISTSDSDVPKSAMSELLVGTPAANRPQATNTINLNFAQLQNVHVRVPVFGNIQGHSTSFIVSLPVTTATTSSTITQAQASNSASGGNSLAVGTPTVVLANTAGTSNLAHLMSSGIKGISHEAIRNATPHTVTIAQGGQTIQRTRQQPGGNQQNLQTIQGTPITIKMAATNANASQVTKTSNASLASHLPKQAQLQHFQQRYLNEPSVMEKIRRRSNTSDQQ